MAFCRWNDNIQYLTQQNENFCSFLSQQFAAVRNKNKPQKNNGRIFHQKVLKNVLKKLKLFRPQKTFHKIKILTQRTLKNPKMPKIIATLP